MKTQDFWHLDIYGSYINGELRTNPSEDLISLLTQKPWKKIHKASVQDTRDAIQSAENALKIWREVPPKEKGNILRQVASLLLNQREALAELMAYEMGKTKRDGLAEVAYAAGFFSWFAGEAIRLYEPQIKTGQKTIHHLKEPVGVCGLITPWNFPLAMPARKFGAALAAGCSVVLKPSPECPLSALFMAAACTEAGIPPGVVNIVIGPEDDIGRELLSSPIVRKIGFTGSTSVGKYLYEHSASTLKKLTLELGGHAPVIIHDDADLDHAVEQAMIAKYRNNGQTCAAANRFYVQESVQDQFIEKFVKRVKTLKIGDPLEPDTDLTTILHPSVPDKVQRHVEDAVRQGGEVVLFATEVYEPVVIKNVTHKMLVTQEETFGPVAPIISFKDEEGAYQMANDTPYGLTAYLFTQNYTKIQRGIRQLDFGIIGVNDGLPSSPQLSFGGCKASGFGVEGGPYGIDEYLVSKCASVYSAD